MKEKHRPPMNSQERQLDLGSGPSLWTVFSPDFMSKFTCFESFPELLNHTDMYLKRDPEVVIKSREWDEFIKNHSVFNSWEEMKIVALQEWRKKIKTD